MQLGNPTNGTVNAMPAIKKRIVVLEGLDGSGKSAVATRLCERLQDQFRVLLIQSTSRNLNERNEAFYETRNRELTTQISDDNTHDVFILDRSWLSGEASHYAATGEKPTIRTWTAELYQPTHIFVIEITEENRVQYLRNRGRPLTAEEQRLECDADYRRRYSHVYKCAQHQMSTRAVFRFLRNKTIEEMLNEIAGTLQIDVDILCPRKMTTSNKINARQYYYSWKIREQNLPLVSTEYITLKGNSSCAPNFSPEYRGEHCCHFDNVDKPFDYAEFGKPRHLPVSIGSIEDKEKFMSLLKNADTVQPQDMPIAFPTDSPENYCFRVPKCYQGAEEVVQKAADTWWSLSSKPHKYFCYMSISRDNVESFMYQRRPGIHSDGFQSVRFTAPNVKNHPCEFAVTVCNTLPTVYYLDTAEVGALNPTKDNFFEFIATHTSGPAYDVQEPFEIFLMDGYCLHSGKCHSTAAESIDRIFVRLMFSTKVYDRIGNTINPHFNYSWSFMKREAQLELEHDTVS